MLGTFILPSPSANPLIYEDGPATRAAEPSHDGLPHLDTGGCGYRIFPEKFGRTLTDTMVRRTLEGKRPKVSGLVSRKGTTFEARLVPDKRYGIGITFDGVGRKR